MRKRLGFKEVCQISFSFLPQETKEKKRVELMEKKKELQRLADEEMSQMKGAKQDTLSKLTRAQIQANRERLEAEGMSYNLHILCSSE